MMILIWIICNVAAFTQLHRAPVEHIVLLPSPDGKPSAVWVQSPAGQILLDQPYLTASLDRRGRIVTTASDAAATRERYQTTLAALPQQAAAYVLYFDTATDVLVPESAARLAQIKQELTLRPAPEITVIGHTDTVDTPAYNDALSLKRAETVKQMLVDIGIDASDIAVEGRGERELLVPTKDRVAEPLNRRVEIRVR